MKNALDKFISGLNFIFGIVGIIMVFIATYAVLARKCPDCFHSVE